MVYSILWHVDCFLHVLHFPSPILLTMFRSGWNIQNNQIYNFLFPCKSTLSGLMISQYLDVIFQLICNVILTTIMLLDIEMSLIIWQHIIIGKLHFTGKTFSVHFPTYFNTLSSYKAVAICISPFLKGLIKRWFWNKMSK